MGVTYLEELGKAHTDFGLLATLSASLHASHIPQLNPNI